ncbi:MAG: hypothetical protein ACOYJZ_06710 [Acutalibacter sp.]|jgi:hypothetical protein
MELLFWSGVIFLAALGLMELVRMGVFWLLRPRGKEPAALVVMPREADECEFLIRAGMARLQWMDWRGCQLICVVGEEDEGSQAICRVLQRRYPDLQLCKQSDLVYDSMNKDT